MGSPLVHIEKVEIHNHYNVDLSEINSTQHLILKTLRMNQAELLQALTDVKTQVDKSKAELVAKIADLEAAIANGGNTTPEIDAALQALKDAVQSVDDIVPDAPPA